jgi:hypothetical protein
MSLTPVGFEPTTSAGERPQPDAFDRAANVIGTNIISGKKFKCYIKEPHTYMWLD